MAAYTKFWQVVRQNHVSFSRAKVAVKMFSIREATKTFPRYFLRKPLQENLFPVQAIEKSIWNSETRRRYPHAILGFSLAFLGFFKKKEKQEMANVQRMVQGGVKAINDGDLKLADRIFHKALEMVADYHKDEKLTDDEQLNANTFMYSYMANLAMAQDEFENAEKLYKETMKGLIHLGMEMNHNAIVEISIKLASIYAMTGRAKEACEGYKFCIEIQEKKVSEMDDPDENTLAFLGIALESYGRFLMSGRDFAKAEPLLVQSSEIAKQVYGDNNPQTLNLLNDVATVKISLLKYTEAEDILKTAIITGQKISSPMVAVLYCNVGALYLRQSEYVMAKAACEKAHTLASLGRDEVALKRAESCLKKLKEKGASGQQEKIENPSTS